MSPEHMMRRVLGVLTARYPHHRATSVATEGSAYITLGDAILIITPDWWSVILDGEEHVPEWPWKGTDEEYLVDEMIIALSMSWMAVGFMVSTLDAGARVHLLPSGEVITPTDAAPITITHIGGETTVRQGRRGVAYRRETNARVAIAHMLRH
ncbi:MAG: hypothetical protein HXO58_07195 [Rothia mucilaginosa]|uniref:Uncharacterized protein n=1 Tax=Rothia mucilaginosa TaxID=43675 RepID=A0A930L616_9MICC|nr:hypothetical protein [Rothia mucilaginosa]MBF1659604.1 hypothetical protein [Rothia mucilaginosa]